MLGIKYVAHNSSVYSRTNKGALSLVFEKDSMPELTSQQATALADKLNSSFKAGETLAYTKVLAYVARQERK